MKFSVSIDAITNDLAWCMQANLPSAATANGITVTIRDGQVALFSRDDTAHATATPRCSDVEGEGRAIIPGRTWHDVCRRATTRSIATFTITDKALTVEGSSSTYEIPVIPERLGGEAATTPPELCTLDGAAFKEALGSVATAASGDNEALPIIAAIHLRGDGQNLTIEATDRYRVHEETIDAPVEGEWLISAAKALKLAKITGNITLLGDGNHFGVRGGEGRTWVTALTAGEYPMVDRLWPKGPPAITAGLIPGELTAALSAAAAVQDANAQCDLAIRGGEAEVRMSGISGYAVERIWASDVTGDPMMLRFNPSYLVGAMKHLRSREVRLQATGTDAPVVFLGDDGRRALVMPVRQRDKEGGAA